MNEATKAVIDVSGKDFRESIPGDGGTVETGPGTPNKEMRKLRDNPLDGFRNGACLDLRVRFAMELLKSQMASNSVLGDEANAAGTVLRLADELFAQAEEHGWIAPLPDATDTEISDDLRAQAKRTADYQVIQQIEGGKTQQREASRQLTPAGHVLDMVKGGPGRH